MAKLLVIGSGPAGVTAAIYAKRGGMDVTVISRGVGTLNKAHMIENYYGFPEPITGPELEERGIEQAKKLGVEFIKSEVTSLGFEDRLTVSTPKEKLSADAVLLATGNTRKSPKIKGLKDLEGKGVSYCAVCDGFFYKDKSVAVLGSGEYAIHEVEALLPIAKEVSLLTNGEELKAELPQGALIDERKISKLSGDDSLQDLEFEDGGKLLISGFFVAQGVAGSTDLARKIGAAIDGNRILVDENMKTNIPGLYAAGDCVGGVLQVATAVGEGAIAGMTILKDIKNK